MKHIKGKFPKRPINGSKPISDQIFTQEGNITFLSWDFIDTAKLFIDTEDYTIIAEMSETSKSTVMSLLNRTHGITRYNSVAVEAIVDVMIARMNQYKQIINKYENAQSKSIQHDHDHHGICVDFYESLRRASTRSRV